MSPRKSVSEKNTKPEILAAYQELLIGAGEQPVLIKETEGVLTDLNDVGGEATKQLAELKLSLAREIDKMGAKLARGIEAVQQVQVTASKERARLLELHTEHQRALNGEISTVRTVWEREQREHDQLVKDVADQQAVERTREEEAYQYQQSIARRNELDEFKRDKAARESTLAEHESTLKEREKAMQIMEKELEAVPIKIEAATKEADKNLTARLTAQHTQALHEQQVANDHTLSLAKLTIDHHEATIKRQLDELNQLKREQSTAQEQLKQMAVAVIDTRKPAETPLAERSKSA